MEKTMTGQTKNVLINDALYGWISLSEKEIAIVNTPIFQRLRLVRQLTFVHYVFPGANHTRFEHCLGVFHIAGKYAQHLYPKDEKKRQTIKLAALLHDIGHGPFSHSWDKAVYSEIYPGTEKGHDQARYRIVREVLSELIKDCQVDPEDIIDIWSGKDVIGKAVINGPVGSDRIDFIQRDAYHCGTVHFGTIAAERIIHESSIRKRIVGYDTNDQPIHDYYLHYSQKVVADIIQAVNARFYQYNSVYYHKTVTSASLLVEDAIKRSIGPLNLLERTKDLSKFVDLSDESLLCEIALSPNTTTEAKEIVSNIRKRLLPKLDASFITDPSIDAGPISAAKNWCDHDPDCFYIVPSIPIHTFDPKIFEKERIYVFDGSESITFEQSLSHQSQLRGLYDNGKQPYHPTRIYKKQKTM